MALGDYTEQTGSGAKAVVVGTGSAGQWNDLSGNTKLFYVLEWLISA